jgi:anti-sigma B factor antagonist
MEISENRVGSVNIVCPCGRLDAFAASEIEKNLNSLADLPGASLIVNMEKLEYISSGGLRVLLGALKKARKQKGDIRLSCLQPGVREVFDIAGFTQLFKIFDKEQEALKSYQYCTSILTSSKP